MVTVEGLSTPTLGGAWSGKSLPVERIVVGSVTKMEGKS